jgi:hypothetical protein
MKALPKTDAVLAVDLEAASARLAAVVEKVRLLARVAEFVLALKAVRLLFIAVCQSAASPMCMPFKCLL